jgi:hypothetical protein
MITSIEQNKEEHQADADGPERAVALRVGDTAPQPAKTSANVPTASATARRGSPGRSATR